MATHNCTKRSVCWLKLKFLYFPRENHAKKHLKEYCFSETVSVVNRLSEKENPVQEKISKVK